MTKQQTSALAHILSQMSKIPTTIHKNHLNNKVYWAVPCIQLETKSLNVYQTQMQPNRQQLMLPEEWRGMRFVNCIAFQTAPRHQHLLTRRAGCFLHQLPAPRGFNWELCIGQLYKNYYPVCTVSIHISERTFLKFYPTDSLQRITQRAVKTRAFPTPVGQSSRLWHGVHYTDQRVWVFF